MALVYNNVRRRKCGSSHVARQVPLDNQRLKAGGVELDAGGLDNLELHPAGPSTITGQVRIEGDSKSKVSEVHIDAGRFEGDPSIVDGGVDAHNLDNGKIAEHGSFALHDLSPEIYHLMSASRKACT